MYGHSAGPPPSRGAATVITLRVLFAAVGLLTCGLLACVPLFRVAFLRGRWYDWTAAWASLPLSIACLAVIGSLPESDHRTDIALALLLLIAAAATVSFLVADIRLHAAPHPYPGQVPPPHTTAVSAPSGFQVAQPHHPTVVSPFYGPAHPVGPYAPPAVQHPVAPPPQPPAASPRIDQVRAELDELSDYLRHHDGGHHDGGRPRDGR